MVGLSDLDWPRILYSRTAAILLGIAALLTISTLIFRYSDFDPNKLGKVQFELISYLGAFSALGFLSLLICMVFFWLRCDVSSKLSRTIWFVVLLLGFLYGSQIAYYAFAYLPAVIKRLRNPEVQAVATLISSQDEDQGRIGPFRRSLVLAWGIVAVLMLAMLVVPAPLSLFSPPIAVIFFFCSVVVAIESVIHWFVSIYRSGMARPPAPNEHSSRPRNDKQS